MAFLHFLSTRIAVSSKWGHELPVRLTDIPATWDISKQCWLLQSLTNIITYQLALPHHATDTHVQKVRTIRSVGDMLLISMKLNFNTELSTKHHGTETFFRS